MKLYHLNKLLLIEESLTNILQFISTLHCFLFASYDTAKLTSKQAQMGMTQALTYPCCLDREALCKYTRYFVLELRKKDGRPYPPSSIHCILCGLNRVLKENGVPFLIMNKGDQAFRELFLTLDTVTSSLHREGVGAMKAKASVISYEHEAIFWEKKLLGYDTPQSLQRAVFLEWGLILSCIEKKNSTVCNPNSSIDFPQMCLFILKIAIIRSP